MSLLKDQIELNVELAEYQAKETLLHYPPLLRWLLIIFILMLIPGYYIARSVSYNYWSKSYSAFAIAAKQSFQNPKPPAVSDITVTTAGGGSFSAIVQITNNNLDLSLAAAPYEFTFLGENGQTLYHKTGQTFLLPNEKKYVIIPRFSAAGNIKSANFRFTLDLQWQKKISIPKVNIQTSVPNTYNQLSPQAFAAEGAYYNNSSYQLGQVRLVFVIFNQGNKIIGVGSRDDFTVNPFEQRAYKQLWPGLFAEKGAYVKVYAETNTLDPANLSVPANTSGSASDLSR